MSLKPTVAKALDPAVIAGTVRAAQQQRQQHPHLAAQPSHLSRILAIGIWVAFLASLVAVFTTNR